MARKRSTATPCWLLLLLMLDILPRSLSFVGQHSPRIRKSSWLAGASHILVVDWDRCLADTVDWRIQIGMQAASRAWPKDVIFPDDTQWLENKLSSLSHVLDGTDEYSSTVEYALCARLLHDEQRLDGGRSVGKLGKYASRFHPQSDDLTMLSEPSNDGRSTRPLTVGEIGENWEDCLKETTMMRYNIDRKNPLPILQKHIDDILRENELDVPDMDAGIWQTLEKSNSCRFVVLSGETEFDVALQSLKNRAPGVTVGSVSSDNGSWSLLCRKRGVVEELISETPVADESVVLQVVTASFGHLKRLIPLANDIVPDQDGTIHLANTRLRLSLADGSWASDLHPSAEISATMNPWTRLCNLQEL